MAKKVYALLMTYQITDEEKRYAEQSLNNFHEAVKLLKLASDHLNIIKTPFKDNPPSTEEEILENRVSLRRFRDKCAENFNSFKIKAFSCINAMKSFFSDTMTSKLMKSFIASIDVLEASVNDFLDLFNDLKDKDFQTKVVSSCENIEQKCNDIIDIVDQRIVNHIQTNILSKTWVNSVSDQLQSNVEKHVPILTQIQQEEKEKFNNLINKGK